MKTLGQKMGELSQKKYREKIGEKAYLKRLREISKKGGEAMKKKHMDKSTLTS